MSNKGICVHRQKILHLLQIIIKLICQNAQIIKENRVFIIIVIVQETF